MSSRCPLISVIIPTYNQAQFIEEAVESVLGQSYRNLEIIVVDDGSTDNTKDILRSYIEKKKIHYFYQENSGVSSARNMGVRVSHGEYISFLDSDDFWAAEHLQQLLNAMWKYPMCSIAFSATETFGDAKDATERSKAFKYSVSRCLSAAFDKKDNGIWLSNKNLLQDLLERGFPFRCPASLIKKDFFFKYNLFFDEDITFGEDAQFMTIAAYYTPFIYIDKVGVFIRRHRGNDGDAHYGQKIIDSFDSRVIKLKRFFHGKLKNKEKKALMKRLWSFQVSVMEARSKDRGLYIKVRESMKLFLRVPCYLSFKSITKLLIMKN